MSFRDITEKLEEYCVISSLRKLSKSRLGNQYFKALSLKKEPILVKHGVGLAGRDIPVEAQRLEWLNQRCYAPKLIWQFSFKNEYCSVMHWLEGESAHLCNESLGGKRLVKIYAHVLREIHALEMENYSLGNVVDSELSLAIKLFESGSVNCRAFYEETSHKADSIIKHLESHVPLLPKTSFTHGDYCLPNLLLKNSVCSGIVDWGQCGLSNPNRDFFSVEISLKRNNLTKHLGLFFDVYGKKHVDREQMRLFYLLDRFFVHNKNITDDS